MCPKHSFRHALLAVCALFAISGCAQNTKSLKSEHIVYQNVSARGPAVLPAQVRNDFIKAADLTSLLAMKKDGLSLFRFDGSKSDALSILKEQGFNYIKLSQMVYPYDVLGQSYGAGISDLDSNIELAKDVSEFNMNVILDLTLSDFFTNSLVQTTPETWSNLSRSDLNKTVSVYAKTTIDRYLEKGVKPKIIEIGSGLNHGLLWPLGKIDNLDNSSSVNNAAELIKAAISGVKSSYKGAKLEEPKLMLSFDLGVNQDINVLTKLVKSIASKGVKFDVLALNIDLSQVHDLNVLSNNLDVLGKTLKYNILVVEKNRMLNKALEESTKIGEHDSKGDDLNTKCSALSDDESTNQLRSLLEAISNSSYGQGFVYWEPFRNVKPASLNLSSSGISFLNLNSSSKQISNNLLSPCVDMPLFDEKGRVLKSIKVFNDFL